MDPFYYLCFVFVCHTLQPCCHLLKRDDLLALLYVMFSCIFVTFPYGVLDQVWYLIVLIPDLCLLPYFEFLKFMILDILNFRHIT